MKSISNVNFRNKNIILRVDFNVPLNESLEITDNTRIKASIPTIQKIISDGGKVIIISHMGRPENIDKKLSLFNIKGNLEDLLNKKITFLNDCTGEEIIKRCNNEPMGSIILLENLRFHKEENKGNIHFAKELSKLGDIFINDAFGAIHRKSASIYELPKLFNEKYAGLLLEKELSVVDKILNNKNPPVTAIIGGAKVSTKLPIINNLMDSVDNIIIGGAMMYTFIKAKGGSIGKSLVEDSFLNPSLEILEKAKEKGINIYLPTDSIIAKEFNNNSYKENIDIYNIPQDYIGLDIGEETKKVFSEIIKNSKTILWNGPMGVFEMPNFASGTIEIGEAIVEATKNGSFSLVGGGDSVAAAKQFKLDKDMSYISTGGGAMLEALEGKILPGMEVL